MAEISAELEQAILTDPGINPQSAQPAKPVDTGAAQPEIVKPDNPAEATETTTTDDASQVEVTAEDTTTVTKEETSKGINDDEVLKYVKEKTGLNLKTLDELKSTLSVKKELEKLQKENLELKAIAPTDDNSKKLFTFLKDGGTLDAFQKLQKLDSKMSARDKMVEYYVLKHEIPKDNAEAIVDEKYKTSEDWDETDRSVKAARAMLEIDAKQEADTFINKWKQDAVTPKEDLKAQQLAEKWGESIPKVIETISDATKFSFGGNSYKYNFTKEQSDSLADDLKGAIQNIPDNIDPNTPQGKEYISQMGEFLAWGKHGRSMTNAILESHKANEIKKKANTTVGLHAQNADSGIVDVENALLQQEKSRYGRA